MKKDSPSSQLIELNVIPLSINITSLEFDEILNAHLKILRSLPPIPANSSNLTLVSFPALSLTGPGCLDAFLRPSVLRKAVDLLFVIEKEIPQSSVVSVGLPIAFEGRLYQSTAFFAKGKLRGLVCAQEGELISKDDRRQFSEWDKGKVTVISLNGRSIPIGDLSFYENGLVFSVVSLNKLAKEVGERLDPFINEEVFNDKLLYGIGGALPTPTSSNSSSILVKDGNLTEESIPSDATVCLLCSGALPFAIGRQQKIRTILEKSSKENQRLILCNNFLGVESGSNIYDGGSIVAFDGDSLQLSRFQYKDVNSACCKFELKSNDLNRVVSIIRNNQVPESLQIEAWEKSEDRNYEEIARSVSLAMFDYMRKSYSQGFALSMSGGADSATIATLVRIGILLGTREQSPIDFLTWLGKSDQLDTVKKRYPQTSEIIDEINCYDKLNKVLTTDEREHFERKLVKSLLVTVYQSTRNSGAVTREAAQKVSDACGAQHFEFSVDNIVEEYKELVAKATGSDFCWAKDDVTLQNIQARGRAPSAWLLANRLGRLLLATSNRSEVSCGYATMDGDTCGGLSPIAGIEKAVVRKWLVWLEKKGLLLDSDGQRWTLPELRYINDQQPTAELRPQEKKQTDEADLMPYPILNMFERALIRDRLTLSQAYKRVKSEALKAGFQIEDSILFAWGAKFCKLFSATQWKRQRYAPSFSIDDYDLSPSSWFRFPIISGGFKFEQVNLDQKILSE